MLLGCLSFCLYWVTLYCNPEGSVITPASFLFFSRKALPASFEAEADCTATATSTQTENRILSRRIAPRWHHEGSLW